MLYRIWDCIVDNPEWREIVGKVIFFDIDRTSIDFQQYISDDIKQALKQARKNKHKIVLCTDKPYTNIYPCLMEMPFDGFVASAGAYVRFGDEVVAHYMLDNEKVSEVLRLLWKHNAVTLTQGVHARYATAEHAEKIREFFRRQNLDGDKMLNGITVVENPSGKAALESIMYMEADVPFEVLCREVQEKSGSYFHMWKAGFGNGEDNAGIIARNGVTKESGMAELLDYWEVPRKDSAVVRAEDIVGLLELL